MATKDDDAVQDGFARVLYVDHRGHPAPLLECFHATASRRLSSTVHRYPVSTVQEADSAYCPQCLSFHDAATAADLGYCPKAATCQRCPVCLSVASVHAAVERQGGKTECFYQCGLCEWTSKECNLSVELQSMDRLELMRAAEDMGAELVRRRRNATQPPILLHKHASEQCKSQQKEQLRLRQQQRQTTSSRTFKYAVQGEWSVETLEAKLHETYAAMHSDPSSVALPKMPGLEMKRISPTDDDAATAEIRKIRDCMPLISYQMQALHAASTTGESSELPLPIPLAVRKSRRCRAELDDGRPGILVKPKLNPLEGDSSLPTGHGQWHRKDSSAIQVIPRVSIVKQLSTGTGAHCFLIKVANPTLGTVRLRMTESSYQGEADYWTDDDDDDDAEPKITTLMTGLLVDTVSQTFVDVKLKPDLTKGVAPSETVELMSAEDSIIEVGGKARDTPEQVVNWDPTLAGVVSTATLRAVAQSASDAWFELVLPDGKDSPSVASAIPIALEVDLGNGSWESSLVSKQEGVENDKVVFDLVLVWS